MSSITTETELPASLSWHDVTYEIPLTKRSKSGKSASQKPQDLEVGQEKIFHRTSSQQGDDQDRSSDRRVILSGVSGSLRRGQMMAVLGASGAGKTTLLNTLSARLSSTGTLGGKILLDGKPRNPSTWKNTIGFVEQDDLMLGCLTVYEQISFSARLRMADDKYNKDERLTRVEDVISMLRLEKCQDTRIGDANARGISGGERKRTSIGMELVSDVSVLFLDEPTSGLDAFAAHHVVEHLKHLATQRQLSCLATIHQPSWKCLQLFDTVQLLAQGHVFYDGPPSGMSRWFDSLGYPVPEGANPADHYISLAENAEKSSEGEQRIHHLISAWAQQAKQHDAVVVDAKAEGLASADNKTSAWPIYWTSELAVLGHRIWLQLIRDKQILVSTAAQTVALLIIIGFAWFRLGHSQADVLARIGVLFFLPINVTFATLFPILTPFAVQRSLMKRERSARTYRTSSFFLARVLVDVPSTVAQKLPFFLVLYWMVGLKSSAAAYFIFVAMLCLHSVVAVALGLLIGSFSPSLEVAQILAPFCAVIFLLFGGNLLPSPPPWFVWLRWISPITYTYMAIAQNEFQGQTFSCEGVQQGQQCYTNGQQVLDQYNLHTFTIGETAGFLVALAAAFCVLGYVGLRFTARPRFRFS